jgi:hypothetical protein
LKADRQKTDSPSDFGTAAFFRRRWARGLIGAVVLTGGLLAGLHWSAVVHAKIPRPLGMPPAKAALFAKQNARLQRARQHPTPKVNPASYTPPPVTPPPALQAGIQPMQESPLPPMQFLANHAWTAPLKGSTWVRVWTGQQLIPSEQGAVYVITITRQSNGQFFDTLVGLFVAPTGLAPLYPIGWSGTTLQLVTSTGQRLVFNAATDTFSVP